MPSFFFRDLQLITVLLLTCDELKHKNRLCKTVCGIFHFRFRFPFIKVYIFGQQKCMGSLTSKHHNSFQNPNNRKATHGFVPRSLIFKLQQEVWKLNDICVSCSSPKTDLFTYFLNLKNRSFENVRRFSQK